MNNTLNEILTTDEDRTLFLRGAINRPVDLPWLAEAIRLMFPDTSYLSWTKELHTINVFSPTGRGPQCCVVFNGLNTNEVDSLTKLLPPDCQTPVGLFNLLYGPHCPIGTVVTSPLFLMHTLEIKIDFLIRYYGDHLSTMLHEIMSGTHRYREIDDVMRALTDMSESPYADCVRLSDRLRCEQKPIPGTKASLLDELSKLQKRSSEIIATLSKL